MITGDALAPTLDTSQRFSILALDHRDSLRVMFDPTDPAGVPEHELVRFKIDVVEAFGDRPSAVMLDPETSIEQILVAGRLPAGVGSLCALEAQGYLHDGHAATNRLLDGWSPQRARSVGASAAKLLVLYRPDGGSVTDAQDQFIRSVVDGCRDAGLPLFVEPVPYDIKGVDDRERTIVESAARISALGPDVLKLPFPSDAHHPDRWARACKRVHDAIDVPWAVLSWGAPIDLFVEQTRVACANGCAGFMAGRAIWGDSIGARDRATHLAQVALPRFNALVAATKGE